MQDPEQRADTQQEANGLHNSLSYLDTVFMAVFWNNILERFNSVSMALQSPAVLKLSYEQLSNCYSHFETGRMVTFPCSARENGPKICWSDKKYSWHCIRTARLLLSTTDLELTCVAMYQLHTLVLRFLYHGRCK